MANKIQLRRDLSTNWTTVNPILTDGEPGLETDTNKIKYGDGTMHWNCLSYAVTSTGTGNISFVGTTLNGPSCSSFSAGPAHGNVQIVPNGCSYYVNHGQYVNIYPTVNTDSPHIHIAAGSGTCQSGDLILGDDDKNVSIVNDGNVQINSYAGSTQHRWIFENTGNLTLPSGGTLTKILGETTLYDPSGAAIATSLGNAVAVNGSIGVGLYSNNNTWLFDTTGKMIFPDSTAQKTAYQVVKSGFNILNPVISMDNIKASIDGSGNPTVGAVSADWSGPYSLQAQIWSGSNYPVTTYGNTNATWLTAFAGGIGVNFSTVGDMVVGYFTDNSDGHIYKITWIATASGPTIGYGYIEIEKLV